MTLGANDEEVLKARTSFLFPGWTDRNFDTYFRWFKAVPGLSILRFILGWDYGDGIETVSDAAYRELFDAATRAGVRLIPQLMHPGHPQKAKYALGTAAFDTLIVYERAAIIRLPTPYAWDLANEFDVNGPFSPTTYAPWVRGLVGSMPAGPWILTVGHQGFGGGLWGFSQATFNACNDVPGLDLPQVHWYGPDTNPSNTIGNYLGVWAKALGKPCLAGEFGSQQRFWPEFVPLWTYGDALAMYLDGAPGYPPAKPLDVVPSPPPPLPVPDPTLAARIAALETAFAAHKHHISAQDTWPP